MGNSLLFSTARVSSQSKNLLSQDKILKLTEAGGLEAAVKLLYEFGYGGGLTLSSPLEYEKLLKAEETKLYDYILEVMPEGYGFESLFFKGDYHNAKVVAKSKYGNLPFNADALLPKYSIEIEELKNLVLLGEFDKLPTFMRDAFNVIETAFSNGKGSPSVIDVELDKAYYFAVSAYLRRNLKAKPIKDFFIAKVDMQNIINFFRCKKVGFDFAGYCYRFMPTGSLELDAFKAAYEQDDLLLTDLLNATNYQKFLEVCLAQKDSGSYAAAETMMDNLLLKELHQYKNDVFSVGLVVDYYISKSTEIKEIKIILACAKNSVSSDEIKKRLRELYA